MQTPIATKPRSLTITLRGEQYKAERLTKTHYVALGSLVRDKGKMPDLDQPGVRIEVAEQMLVKIADPEFIKRLSYSLLAIFPTLSNNNLVWFQPEGNAVPPWGTALEIEEIMEIIEAVSNALQSDLVVDLREQQEREKAAKIAELEQALATLKQS